MKKIIFFSVYVLLLCIWSCTAGTDDKQHVILNEQEMIDYFNSFNPQWRKAIHDNNPDYIIARYSEDAIIGAPNKDFIVGKKAIAEHWRRIIRYMDDFSYKTTHIGGDPNGILFENGEAYGTYTLGDRQVRDTSKYLFVWRHIGNKQYEVLSEMFNSKK